MSGLILPKHWRFNWPLLMGHLQLTSGHLSRTSTEHLAKCDDGGGYDECCYSGHPALTVSSITVPDAGGCCSILAGTYITTAASACVFRKSVDFSPGDLCTAPFDCAISATEGYIVRLVEVQATLNAGNSISGRIYIEAARVRKSPSCVNLGSNEQLMNYTSLCKFGVLTYVSSVGPSILPCHPATITIA
jgi:hypothetical protein